MYYKIERSTIAVLAFFFFYTLRIKVTSRLRVKEEFIIIFLTILCSLGSCPHFEDYCLKYFLVAGEVQDKAMDFCFPGTCYFSGYFTAPLKFTVKYQSIFCDF